MNAIEIIFPPTGETIGIACGDCRHIFQSLVVTPADLNVARRFAERCCTDVGELPSYEDGLRALSKAITACGVDFSTS